MEDIREEKEILLSEAECAIKELKTGKPPFVGNINEEQIQCGGDVTVIVLHNLCNAILKTKQWPNQWMQIVLITIPREANSRKYSDHRTIRMISHASKCLLKIFQNRITPRIE